MKILTMIIVGLMLTSCSELLVLSSIGGVAVSQSPAVKAYNGVDMLTIMKTEKDIKKHVYENVKDLYDKTKY